MVADRGQVIPIPRACHIARRIARRSFVEGIEVQFEVLVHFLAVIFWVTQKAPRFKPLGADVVGDTRVVLVVGLIWWFTRPFLDVLWVRPFWCVAVCDRCHLSDLATVAKGMPTCTSHAEVNTHNEVGLPSIARHLSRITRVFRCQLARFVS